MMTTRHTELRRLGNSAIRVTTLGFGAAPIGNLYQPMTDEQAAITIEAALAQGIRFFDTAPFYGFGLSESRLGDILAGSALRSEIILSSKVGRLLEPMENAARERYGFVDCPPLNPVFDYSYDAVMRSFEESCKRLKTDKIPVLLAHDLGPLTHGEQHPAHFKAFLDGGYRAMAELKQAGVVSAIGIGANEWQICEQALGYADFDTFLLAGRYTLLEQTACDSFLPLCKQRGVTLIIGGPYNSGILASGVSGKGPFYYNYAPAPQAIIERVQKLEKVCAEHQVLLPAAALQFAAAHPQVASVIAGYATIAQCEQAVALMNLAIPTAFWQSLRKEGLLHEAAVVPEND
jgi:D-threo-aldose 1-dehydrogenase